MSLLAIQSDGGFTSTKWQSTGENRASVEAQLAIALAGRAAERLLLGQVSAGSGGHPCSDLAKATQLAYALEASWGLGASLIWQGPVEGIEARLRYDADLRAKVEIHLRHAEERAMQILKANLALLSEFAVALDTIGVLAGPELAALIARVSREPDLTEHHTRLSFQDLER